MVDVSLFLGFFDSHARIPFTHTFYIFRFTNGTLLLVRAFVIKCKFTTQFLRSLLNVFVSCVCCLILLSQEKKVKTKTIIYDMRNIFCAKDLLNEFFNDLSHYSV